MSDPILILAEADPDPTYCWQTITKLSHLEEDDFVNFNTAYTESRCGQQRAHQAL